MWWNVESLFEFEVSGSRRKLRQQHDTVWPPSRTVAFKRSHFIYSLNIKIFQNFLYIMVFTRAQLDTLSREELVKELIKRSNIADQLKNLTESVRWLRLQIWKVAIRITKEWSKNDNSLLLNRIINLERNTLSKCSIYKKRNTGDKSCSSFNKQCWPWGKSLRSPVFDWH